MFVWVFNSFAGSASVRVVCVRLYTHLFGKMANGKNRWREFYYFTTFFFNTYPLFLKRGRGWFFYGVLLWVFGMGIGETFMGLIGGVMSEVCDGMG